MGALRKWREVAAELKECARLAGGALNRMLKRQLSRAWEQWQQVAAEAREQMELLRRGVMRMLQRQLSMAFLKWREAAAELKKCARILGKEWSNFHFWMKFACCQWLL